MIGEPGFRATDPRASYTLRVRSLALLAALVCASGPGCTPRMQVVPQAAARQSAHGAKWAEPLERAGLPNLQRVSPLLYRGAQPTREGFLELRKLGVKSVISLRAFHADDIPIDADLAYERISFKAWHPEDEDVVRFLKLVSDPARAPVFVHCQWGSDRTGMMIAIERVALEGWTKEAAIEEMTQGGFGFHPEWQNLVEYVRKLDVERLAREAGIRG
jgi:protein tyrosine/serine phosphatase